MDVFQKAPHEQGIHVYIAMHMWMYYYMLPCFLAGGHNTVTFIKLETLHMNSPWDLGTAGGTQSFHLFSARGRRSLVHPLAQGPGNGARQTNATQCTGNGAQEQNQAVHLGLGIRHMTMNHHGYKIINYIIRSQILHARVFRHFSPLPSFAAVWQRSSR